MMTKPPGVEDIFPDRMAVFEKIVSTAKRILALYNYREIVIPVIEFTDLFARGLGDETDIVSKEMFTFEDRGGRSLTLRPEGTASVVRAYVENGEYNRLSCAKLFYCGQMFRAERPQRGRLRQFNQIGAELFGSAHPYYDFEIIAIADSMARETGIGQYRLLINSIGCPVCRPEFLADLKNYYTAKKDRLCEDCGRRLDKNPLRLLDCKNEKCSALKPGAPKISEHLCRGCAEHHSALKGFLDGAQIEYEEDPLLVRGLDYYTRTTFELVTERLGGQNAFAAGGRYDNMVEVFGGKPTPAVGFAAGIERMMLLLEGCGAAPEGIDVYLIHTGGDTLAASIKLAAELRRNGLRVDIEPEAKGFKSQFKKADREAARFAVITGDDELARNECTVKNMKSGGQESVSNDDLISYLTGRV